MTKTATNHPTPFLLRHGDEEDLKRRELTARQAYANKKHTVAGQRLILEKIKLAIKTRRERWIRFQDHITLQAQTTFTYLLLERQFRGQLNIDHARRTMDVDIEPDITRRSDAGRQAKTLSGGEKSFSTICMILALWQAMGSPIRCLDELYVPPFFVHVPPLVSLGLGSVTLVLILDKVIGVSELLTRYGCDFLVVSDVFMDNVNRDVSMQMLVKTARRSPSRQFIFLSPQAMTSVRLDSDVKIIKYVLSLLPAHSII